MLEKPLTQKESLTKFIIDYSKTHDFISKTMLSGLYISTVNPIDPYQYFNKQMRQKAIKRKMAYIFDILKNLEICEPYNKNAVKINREKLEEYSLQDILKYKNSDFNKK